MMASKKAKGGDGDIIRSLPDEVLCHILSFLPTKYSVRTRLLSTRWKHLFSFVPNLDFKFNSISGTGTGTGTAKSFVDFVNSVFVLYNVSRMNKFSLLFWNPVEDPDNFPICWWISSAILRHVQEIVINIHLFSSVHPTMPHHLFSSKTLTTLSLIGFMNFVLPASQSVCLPCLRTCFLQRVCFDDESAKRLFRSCPALEDLELRNCSVAKGVKLLDISSHTLKRLIIDELENVYQLVLDVPNLITFKYVGPPMHKFLGLESLKTVVDAWISVSSETKSYASDGVVVELVRAFSHVKKLTSSCQTMAAFTRSGHSLPKFNKLTSLMFFPISSSSWMLLPSLLDNSPQLEFISLYHEDTDSDFEDDRDSYIFPERVPACLSLHLKEVEFQYFFTLDYDRRLINYFLKYAKNLKKMKITSNLRWKKKHLSEQFEISSSEIVFQRDGGEDVDDNDDEGEDEV